MQVTHGLDSLVTLELSARSAGPQDSRAASDARGGIPSQRHVYNRRRVFATSRVPAAVGTRTKSSARPCPRREYALALQCGLFGDGLSGQGMGVLGELRSMVNDCFQGIFASKPYLGTRGFAIREAVREKGGRSAFVEYDLALGLSLQPIHRLMFDPALKESLGSSSGGHTLLFLDELRLLPKLSHLEDALNFGRSKGVSVVARLQSIEQLDAPYGSEEGRTVIGAFGSLITLHSPDATTMRCVSDRFGTNVTSYRYESVNGQPEDREREGHVVEPWRIRNLGLGEAFVGLSTQTDPFIFHFKKENA